MAELAVPRAEVVRVQAQVRVDQAPGEKEGKGQEWKKTVLPRLAKEYGDAKRSVQNSPRKSYV